jgi:hypothetical protein
MNERIRELKEQAFNFVAEQNMTKKEYFWENIRHDRTLQDRVDKKFAELIVRECAKTIEDVHSKDLGNYLKEVFGVEE